MPPARVVALSSLASPARIDCYTPAWGGREPLGAASGSRARLALREQVEQRALAGVRGARQHDAHAAAHALAALRAM